MLTKRFSNSNGFYKTDDGHNNQTGTDFLKGVIILDTVHNTNGCSEHPTYAKYLFRSPIDIFCCVTMCYVSLEVKVRWLKWWDAFSDVTGWSEPLLSKASTCCRYDCCHNHHNSIAS